MLHIRIRGLYHTESEAVNARVLDEPEQDENHLPRFAYLPFIKVLMRCA